MIFKVGDKVKFWSKTGTGWVRGVIVQITGSDEHQNIWCNWSGRPDELTWTNGHRCEYADNGLQHLKKRHNL